MVEEAIKKADVLIEALPYIKKFQDKVFVIKYGGSILDEEKVRKAVLEDIAFLRFAGIKPLLVHGGGHHINEKLKALEIPVEFINGIRVTNKATLKVVEEELTKLNDLIANEVNAHGVKTKGFKGLEGLLCAEKKKSDKDLGFVGQVTEYNKKKLSDALNTSIPVIAPLAVSKKGQLFNINADDVAFFLASELKAEKLVLFTKVLGVMRDVEEESSLIPTITSAEVEELIEKNVIAEGMVPKVRAAVHAIGEGVGKAHILDAKIHHALLLEIFTDKGIGTEIVG
ncbi:MAG: acetylglutamate kinase [Candidatus Omnitrophota bacterium]|nr:MAG: acetylglutamate kinase [Candidatus Omnitrophota bacterium]